MHPIVPLPPSPLTDRWKHLHGILWCYGMECLEPSLESLHTVQRGLTHPMPLPTDDFPSETRLPRT